VASLLNKEFLANLISTLFSAPIVSTVFCILAPYYLGYSFSLDYLILVMLGIFFYSFLPFSSTFIRIIKREEDIFVSELKERPKHFIAGIVGYVISTIIFLGKNLTYYAIFSLTSLFIALITLVITFKWKISIHMIGFCTPLMLLSIVSKGLFLPSLILTPILMWARVEVKAHKWTQVIAGAALGTFGTLTFTFILEGLFFNS